MTDHDLTTLVREHVTRQEPAFLLEAGPVIARGRRRLRRRRTAAVIASAAVVALGAAVVVPLTGAGDGPGQDIAPATRRALSDYDARQMPTLLDQHVRAVVSDSLDLGRSPLFTASDGQDQRLPKRLWDKASSMSIEYGGHSDHRLSVTLEHSASEAEGSARRECQNMVSTGYDFSCTVTTGPDGSVVTTSVAAKRRAMGMWGAVTRGEIRTGRPVAGDPSHRPITPDQLWFERRVKAVHSGTFVSYVTETVKAPDLETARERLEVPSTDLRKLATDPVLVIPKPPTGPHGCPWTLPGSGASCG